MPVNYMNDNGWITATIESPLGGSILVDPYEGFDCEVVNRNGGRDSFGLKFTKKNASRILTVGSCGEAETLLREIRLRLGPWFWNQDEPEY